MKAIAADLDWSPSDLAHRTTLGGDSQRPFPADDEHLIGLMKATGDFSILATLADLCGYELQPKKERTAELLIDVQAELVRTQQKIEQLKLELGSDFQARHQLGVNRMKESVLRKHAR